MLSTVLLAASDASQSPGTPALIALLIGVPLLVIALISAMVLGPKWSRVGRWRPGQPWQADPVWFGPSSPTEVVAIDDEQRTHLGGARGRW